LSSCRMSVSSVGTIDDMSSKVGWKELLMSSNVPSVVGIMVRVIWLEGMRLGMYNGSDGGLVLPSSTGVDVTSIVFMDVSKKEDSRVPSGVDSVVGINVSAGRSVMASDSAIATLLRLNAITRNKRRYSRDSLTNDVGFV
jgi:hypothetical protein